MSSSRIKKTNAGSDPLERCLETERDGERHDLCWSRQCEQHLDQTDQHFLLFNILDESKSKFTFQCMFHCFRAQELMDRPPQVEASLKVLRSDVDGIASDVDAGDIRSVG